MKIKTVFLLYFFTLSLLTSCNDTNDNQIQNNPINGVWHLKKISGGLIGLNINYNLGDVKWTFNTTNHTLAVENNIITTGPESIYAGLDTGTYSYEVQLEETTQVLFINTVQSGIIINEDNTLKLDEGVSTDGILREFIR